MAEGRDRQLWAHTSSVMALLANINRDPKKCGVLRAADFNPYAEAKVRRRGIPIRADNIQVLKRLL